MRKVQKILNVLYLTNLQINSEKCEIAQSQIEWLGFELTNSGVSPANNKMQGITERLRTTNLKELRS